MTTVDLSEFTVFADCTKKDLKKVSQLASDLFVEAGRQITTQGAKGRECFFIVSGDVDVERDGKFIGSVGPGELVGEIAMIVGDHERTATARARTDCQVLIFSLDEFGQLLADNPEVGARIEQTAVQRLRDDLANATS